MRNAEFGMRNEKVVEWRGDEATSGQLAERKAQSA